jgi:hypothetical protein
MHGPGADGVRLVTRENGRYVDLMPSPSSSYLLPTLADCSLVRREARTPEGSLRFYGGVVEVEETAEGTDISYLAGLSSPVNFSIALVGLGSFGAATVSSLGRLSSSFSWALAPPEAIRRVFTPPKAPSRVLIPPAVLSQALAEPSATSAPDQLTALERDMVSTRTETSLPQDAPVADVASRIAALSELSDELLAELFKVERETFCRWRTGTLTNPRVGNRRRLGLLLALMEDLAGRRVNIKDWLLNHVTSQGLTPYELLERGRIDEVAFLAFSIGESPGERDASVAAGYRPEPLEFGNDDVWDLQPLDDDEP